MKSKVLISFIIASLVFLILFQVEGYAAIRSTGESQATVEFTVGNEDPTNPVDPEKPEEDLPSTPGTGQKGPLSLDYVSSIDFKLHEVSEKNEIYESSNLKPYIQITDKRGSGEGWTVTAKASGFTKVIDNIVTTEPSLPGSVITLNNGSVASISISGKPIPEDSVELEPGGDAAKVVNAEVGTGMGTWVNRWLSTTSETNDNVKLYVPAGSATVGKHSSSITWTLTDAPI